MPAVPPLGKVAFAPPRPTLIEPVAPERLAESVGARLLSPTPTPRPVTGVTLRAQHVRPGDLFAALPGARAHGADFAGDAIAAGAVAVLTDQAGAERPAVRDSGVAVLVHPDPRAVLGVLAATVYGAPSSKLKVLGVTGTSGKTTTTYMVEAGLAAAGLTTGLIGTVETRLAGERLASSLTTPEAPDLQALFAVMLEQGVSHVAMEVSSHSLAMGRVAGTGYAVGAFTNLSQDHLDFHPDMEDYFATKARLFDGRSEVEVVCTDTDWGQRLVRPGTITVAATHEAAWTASDVRVSATGAQSFTAHGPNGRALPVQIQLAGSFNVANALLAIGVLDAVGIDEKAILQGLAAVQVPGRMERVTLGQSFTAVVDYSHKPEAVALALDAVRARTEGRVLVVLGCGGDRDRGKRPLMGEAAARRADLTVVTDDNPRSEDPAAIRAAMLDGARAVPDGQRGEVVEIGDRREAIRHAVAQARPGDVLVVAGKGHETGQEVAGVVHPFSDRDELTAAILEVVQQ
ncbi:UDP-N-acetylmuramoyl-L-alanyl-D-glutamate--2,6-diaminopimelate ligase [Kutzneria viridogrisea]|uniref:UDP-N-acetylmuramoyl-L-alanyl-D-glutamate--2,6-diaminopimelate ligase n=1 Tax=Kutzneria viridogrisea TaxID=47990 RepID=A0ABR6BFJ7_9PSEU|nr:UDP-N-acetylmuramoyl-L-alanyl-D-glutamate--2,6-diaminopimelate ligase [Kutzneria viridogrisea]